MLGMSPWIVAAALYVAPPPHVDPLAEDPLSVGVDLDDEDTWKKLSKSEKARMRKLRGERDLARSRAEYQTEQAAKAQAEQTAAAQAEEREQEFRDEDRRLVITTALMGGVFAAFGSTSLAIQFAAPPSRTRTGMAIATGFIAVTGLAGTIAGGVLLGLVRKRHREGRPLRVAWTGRGLEFRF